MIAVLKNCTSFANCKGLGPFECARNEIDHCYSMCKSYRTSVEKGTETKVFDGFYQRNVLRACDYVVVVKDRIFEMEGMALMLKTF